MGKVPILYCSSLYVFYDRYSLEAASRGNGGGDISVFSRVIFLIRPTSSRKALRIMEISSKV